MKTFDGVKNSIIFYNSDMIAKAQKELSQPGLKKHEIAADNIIISNAQSNLNNIEEVTTIEIGYLVNSLLKHIRDSYRKDINNYFSDFEKFMEKWVVGEYDKDGKRTYTVVSNLVRGLGITSEDLQCLKDSLPNEETFGDVFRQRVNSAMGTNIPMAGVEESARREWDAVQTNASEEDKERAYVAFKEIQRDAGSLKHDSLVYFVLANNQAYQEAKEHISGRSI